jgi:methyltransferase (TIGR00027 family)
MANARLDSGHGSPLFEVSWQEDTTYRTNPAVLTELLWEQVPVLDFVDFRVTSIDPGAATAVLPLNPPSTNQHFTHQAALIVLAGDYTGGTAILSLTPGWPVVGVHPVTSSKSMALWLLKVDIKYMRPSVADLVVTAEVEPASQERIRRRFLAGKPVIESVPMTFWNGDTKVAEATLTYFARQTDALRFDGVNGGKVNTLYELKLTSSAEMIAGVRAKESGTLYEDDYAAEMAGQHGVALATRFCERLPELGGMVAARTHHLDREILRFLETGGKNLILLGVGWDMRPFRLPMPEGTRIYELDFPTTMIEREARLRELSVENPAGITRFDVPIDLRTTSVDRALEPHFNSDEPVFVAWEGMSMYFEDGEIQDVLAGIRGVMQNPDSRLWVDLVDRKAVETPEACADGIQSFMRAMQILGEPFTFGVDSVEAFMDANGFNCDVVATSGAFLGDDAGPVHDLYQFCVASAEVGATSGPRLARIARVDGAQGTTQSVQDGGSARSVERSAR